MPNRAERRNALRLAGWPSLGPAPWQAANAEAERWRSMHAPRVPRPPTPGEVRLARTRVQLRAYGRALCAALGIPAPGGTPFSAGRYRKQGGLTP